MKKVISLPFDKYKPVSHGDAYVYQKYDLIQSFIRKVFDPSFHNLLLKPTKHAERIDFYSEYQTELCLIEEFPPQQQQIILTKYNVLLHKIELKCVQLEQSDDRDNFEWASLLRKIFNPSTNIILSDGQLFTLAWGWTFESSLNYILPFDAYSDYLHEESIPKNIEIMESKEELSSEESTPLNPNNETSNESQEFEETETSNQETNTKPILPPKRKNGFIRFLDSLEQLFKRFWWLILILILLAIILRFYGFEFKPTKRASEMSTEELSTVYKSIMPIKPGIRIEPIDTNAFKKDETSGSTIIANLVNVALKNKKDDFKHFAVDLKNVFPEEYYKIVYFDDQTRRLQFSFPMEKQSTIASELRAKLTDYDLLIWDESIFIGSKKFSDPYFSDAKKAWYFDRINAFSAWNTTTGSSSITVAVIDDGFDLHHDELKGKAIKPFNVVTDSPNITSGPDRKHGTHVATLAIGKSNNGSGLSGIAPGCSFMPIQAAGSGGFFTQTDIIDAILYAIKNEADVINLSLGKEFAAEISLLPERDQENLAQTFGKDESLFWEEIFTMAHQNKVSIVLAAGNSNMIIGLDPMQRSPRALKVMAIGPSDEKALFSNYSGTKSRKNDLISAPGMAILSAVPNNKYESFDGTSMAAPIVSGSIALMKSIQPKLSDEQIIKILTGTAKTMKNRSTAGLLQLDKALKKISN